MIKISKIAQVCRKHGEAVLFDVAGTQWVQTGYAAYPLYGMPELDGESIKTVLSISEREAEKMVIMEGGAISGVNYRDYESTDTMMNAAIFRFIEDDRIFSAYQVTDRAGETRLLLLDESYFKPFNDCDPSVELMYRRIGEMETVAVMEGLIIVGVIHPAKVDREKLREKMESFAALLAGEPMKGEITENEL